LFNILENLLAYNRNEVNPTLNVDMSDKTNNGITINIAKMDVKADSHYHTHVHYHAPITDDSRTETSGTDGEAESGADQEVAGDRTATAD
jgi:hypothetical protein